MKERNYLWMEFRWYVKKSGSWYDSPYVYMLYNIPHTGKTKPCWCRACNNSNPTENSESFCKRQIGDRIGASVSKNQEIECDNLGMSRVYSWNLGGIMKSRGDKMYLEFVLVIRVFSYWGDVGDDTSYFSLLVVHFYLIWV